jgi:uncharacterized protein YchJ
MSEQQKRFVAFGPKPGFVQNPLSQVPVNSLCPCQSGKKFKKCCRPTIHRYIPSNLQARMFQKPVLEQFGIYREYHNQCLQELRASILSEGSPETSGQSDGLRLSETMKQDQAHS